MARRRAARDPYLASSADRAAAPEAAAGGSPTIAVIIAPDRRALVMESGQCGSRMQGTAGFLTPSPLEERLSKVERGPNSKGLRHRTGAPVSTWSTLPLPAHQAHPADFPRGVVVRDDASIHASLATWPLRRVNPMFLHRRPGQVAHEPPVVHRALPPSTLAHPIRAVAIKHRPDRTAPVRAEVVRPAECRSVQASRDPAHVQRSAPRPRRLVDPAADAADAPFARVLPSTFGRLPPVVASSVLPEKSPTVHPARASGRPCARSPAAVVVPSAARPTPTWLPPEPHPKPVNCPCSWQSPRRCTEGGPASTVPDILHHACLAPSQPRNGSTPPCNGPTRYV